MTVTKHLFTTAVAAAVSIGWGCAGKVPTATECVSVPVYEEFRTSHGEYIAQASPSGNLSLTVRNVSGLYRAVIYQISAIDGNKEFSDMALDLQSMHKYTFATPFNKSDLPLKIGYVETQSRIVYFFGPHQKTLLKGCFIVTEKPRKDWPQISENNSLREKRE